MPVANRAAKFFLPAQLSLLEPHAPIIRTCQALPPRPTLPRTNVYSHIAQGLARIQRHPGFSSHSSSRHIWIRLDRGESSLVWAAGHGFGFKQGGIQNTNAALLYSFTARGSRFKPKVILRSLCRRSLLRYPYDDAHQPYLPIRILHVSPYVISEECQRPARPSPVVRPNTVWPYT